MKEFNLTNNYFDPKFFTQDEADDVLTLFKGVSHRFEFKQLLRNVHNANADPQLDLGSLLRYVDRQQLAGLFSLMALFNSGKGLDKFIASDYLASLY